MKLYHYPNCSTCRKAIKYLQDRSVKFTLINIVEQPPTMTELKDMVTHYDGQHRKLFNTSGVQYRELNLKEKLPELSQEEALELLASDGKLIKRPFLIKNKKQGLVGFKLDQWQDLLDS